MSCHNIHQLNEFNHFHSSQGNSYNQQELHNQYRSSKCNPSSSDIQRSRSFCNQSSNKNCSDQTYFTARFGYLYNSSNSLCPSQCFKRMTTEENCCKNRKPVDVPKYLSANCSEKCSQKQRYKGINSGLVDSCPNKKPIIQSPPKYSENSCRYLSNDKFSNLVVITKYTINTPLCTKPCKNKCSVLNSHCPSKSIVVGYGI